MGPPGEHLVKWVLMGVMALSLVCLGQETQEPDDLKWAIHHGYDRAHASAVEHKTWVTRATVAPNAPKGDVYLIVYEFKDNSIGIYTSLTETQTEGWVLIGKDQVALVAEACGRR